MTPRAAPLKCYLPCSHERVAFANILLLLGLPLAAHLAHLYAISETEEVNFLQEWATALLAYAALSAGALLGWRRLLQRGQAHMRIENFAAAVGRLGASAVRTARVYPVSAIWLAALLGVLVSCYPVVFCGESFLSPNLATELFFGHPPAVPNSPSPRYEDPQGSDVGAALWAHMPYTVMEGRALFHDHELPVWNRYNGGGVTLIGQGQSMIGDPLNLLVVIAGGATWAWDLKFLAARLLFAAAIGLCVRSVTGRAGAACLLAFSACFLDFFTYRLNHPATFSLCYAPLILLAWLWIVRGANVAGIGAARAQLGRVALLLVGCWMELNSGTAKESAMLLLGMNGAGLLVLLLDDGRSWRWKRRALAGLAWAGVGFVLVSTPLWRTLLEALAHSWNYYMTPRAWQLQPGLLIGLFDDIFYRQFNQSEHVLDPSANAVVLLGIACAVAFGASVARGRRAFLALALGTLPPLALVFGVVPPGWICAVPFLGNITHVDNTFSCVLLVILPVLAGVGLSRGWTLLGAPGFARNYAAMAAFPLVLLALFQGTTHAVQRSDFASLDLAGGRLSPSPFFTGYVASVMIALLGLPLLVRWGRVAGAGAAWGVVPWAVLCVGVLLWRGGVQEHAVAGANRCVSFLGPRVDLRIRSAAIDRVLADTRAEPGRYLGFHRTVLSGYSAVFGLEAPSGPDALQSPYYHELLARSGAPYISVWLLTAGQAVIGTPIRRFYDLLNVRYYADEIPPGTTAPADVPGLRTLGRYDLDLYESPTAWPRAFFTDTLISNRGVPELMRTLADGDGRPFAAVAPDELRARPDVGAFSPMLRGPGGDVAHRVVPATGYRLTSRTTSFHLSAPGKGVAVLMEAYQTPYNAQVYLDGRPVPHLRMDEAFMGVLIQAAGEHEVRVVYGPRDLPTLLGAGALGLALLAGTALGLSRSDKKNRDSQSTITQDGLDQRTRRAPFNDEALPAAEIPGKDRTALTGQRR